MKRWAFLLGSIFLGALWASTVLAQTDSHASGSHDASNHGGSYSVRTLPLPDNNAGDVSMDYITYDAATNSVWVPGGNTGAVDVVDVATGKVRQIPGFATKEVEGRNGKRIMGASGVSIGEGVVYIGNRGDASVCAFDSRTLAPGACAHFDSPTDGVVYVAPRKEVCVTTRGDKSIRVVDSKKMEQKTKLTYEGNPEGYAVDAKRGRFYTNMEDKDQTLAIDLKTHKTLATWNPSCGKEGPHGLRLDAADGLLFVACSTVAEVMDVGHDGAVLSKVDTGDGADDLDYSPATHMLYIGGAKDAKLTIAHADPSGHLTVVAQVATPAGARNAAVTKDGTVYMAHAGVKLSALVVVTPSGK